MDVKGLAARLRGRETSALSDRFAQARAKYRRLAASLNALGEDLAALGDALDQPNEAREPYLSEDADLKEGRERPAPPELRAYLLGPFQLMAGQTKVLAEMPGQAQTILKYLIGHRKHPVSREALLDLLWPDASPSVGQGRLRVVMHTLRRSLSSSYAPPNGEELVIPQGSNIMLNPELELWVDVEEFERHWHNGWRLKRDERLTEAMMEYEEAEALYTGDYLLDEPYADWTLLRREALRDAYSTILTMLAGMSFDAGDYMGAVIWSQKLLAQDDCREDAYRHLILSHARLGQPARALYWYNLCARTLKRELGMEPGAETQALLVTCQLHERAAHYTFP